MYICIIANGFQVDYTTNLINSLPRYADKIDFIGSDLFPEDKINSTINFLNLRGDQSEDVSVYKKFIRVIKYYRKLFIYGIKYKPDVIHIQWLRFFVIDGMLFPILFKMFGHKVFYTAHDVLPHDKDNFILRITFKLIYKISNAIVVHTEFIKSRIVKEFNIKPDKILVVKHGVYQIKENKNIDQSIARNKLKINSKDLIILFFGRITKYKGLNLLLEAYKQLKKEYPVKLIIAGKPSDSYKKELSNLIEKYQDGTILFNIGFIEEDDMEILFKSADVTVLPYFEASQSGVLFMSYAFGIPVIGPDIGNFPNDIIDGKTGFVFNTGSIESIKEAIIRFHSHWHESNKNAREYIKEYAKKTYSWDNAGRELVQFYKSKK
ncbi:glycosyltransferase family 4 protein [candidate division KSB1 bacterium]